MKTELIFFDSVKNSINGTIRGLIAFITLIIFDIIRFSATKTYPKNIFAMLLVYLIICSAIGVQLPKTYKETFVYSMLVGFVIYSVLNLYNLGFNNKVIPDNTNSIIINTIINIILGTLSCILASSFIYIIYFY